MDDAKDRPIAVEVVHQELAVGMSEHSAQKNLEAGENFDIVVAADEAAAVVVEDSDHRQLAATDILEEHN